MRGAPYSCPFEIVLPCRWLSIQHCPSGDNVWEEDTPSERHRESLQVILVIRVISNDQWGWYASEMFCCHLSPLWPVISFPIREHDLVLGARRINLAPRTMLFEGPVVSARLVHNYQTDRRPYFISALSESKEHNLSTLNGVNRKPQAPTQLVLNGEAKSDWRRQDV